MAKTTESKTKKQVFILLRDEDGDKTILGASMNRSKVIAKLATIIRGWWRKGGDFNGMTSDMESMKEAFGKGDEWSSPYDCPCAVKRTFRIVTTKAL
jgi:hypothetical protein